MVVKPRAAFVCSVSACRRVSSNNRNAVYYIFPKDLERCSLWVKRCKQIELTNLYREHGTWHIGSEFRVCSDHFAPSDFVEPDNPIKGLKYNAVPSIGVDMEDSDMESLSDSAEANNSDSDDSWDEISVEGDAPASNMKSLKKRLIDNEKENARLKRAVDRLRRQNLKYKRRLS